MGCCFFTNCIENYAINSYQYYQTVNTQSINHQLVTVNINVKKTCSLFVSLKTKFTFVEQHKHIMKKAINFKPFLSAGIVAMAIAAYTTVETGCTKKSSASPAQDTLSSAAIASTLGSLVASSQSGMGPQAESNVSMYQGMNFLCGTIIDTTFSGSDTGSGMNINYSLTYADTAFCSGSTLTKVDFYMNSFMDMSMTNLYSGGKNKVFMSMSGLDSAATNYVVSESCSGIDTVKETVTTSSGTTNLTCYMNMNCTSSNITISKATGMITSGTATVQLSYTTSNGGSYNESATVKYIGNYQAIITLPNGYSQTFTW